MSLMGNDQKYLVLHHCRHQYQRYCLYHHHLNPMVLVGFGFDSQISNDT